MGRVGKLWQSRDPITNKAAPPALTTLPASERGEAERKDIVQTKTLSSRMIGEKD